MQTKSIHYAFSLLLFLGVSFSLNANAQQREITGRVRDAQNNEILAGATVAVEGRQSQTSTDQSGNFQIALAGPDETLIISYVGYQSERVRPDTDHLEVLLQPASKDMEEIVVVAYGTSRRSSITGSVSTINNEQIENRQVASLSKALEGQVPGLQSVSSSGQPGTDAGIRIRGIGSINASSEPLYVVDGNPYSGDINSINPNDIQSISVLKDAASSALYGSRGANGVIIVTTKKGQAGNKTAINLNLTQGISNRAVRDYNQVSTNDYFELYWEALRNKNLSNGQSPENAAKNASENIINPLGEMN